MKPHTVLSHEDWIAARKDLLEKEKAFTRARDDISAARRALPWETVEKDYRFTAADGERTLADLFAGREQLVVVHFMLGPGWEQGCPSCSFMADHYNPAVVHLAHRDVSLVAVSRAPIGEIEIFRQRMGWDFPWVSSYGSDFNQDFQVSFDAAGMEKGEVYYNYRTTTFPASEAPGISYFARGDDGKVYHTYSTYGRGLDIFITAYNFLDHAPKGRDEQDLNYGMEWVRHHDRYED